MGLLGQALFRRLGLAGSVALAAFSGTDPDGAGTTANREPEQQSGAAAPGSGQAGVGQIKPADGQVAGCLSRGIDDVGGLKETLPGDQNENWSFGEGATESGAASGGRPALDRVEQLPGGLSWAIKRNGSENVCR